MSSPKSSVYHIYADKSSVMIAVEYGSVEVVQALLKAGAKLRAEEIRVENEQ